MFAAARTLPHRWLTPRVATQLQFVRNRQEVKIFRLAPEEPVSNSKVGPWPETQEEREKAARKYNLIPEDYQPYSELNGWGDYPDLPAIGAYNRDKYDDFDDPIDNRNYGEPFHMYSDMYHWERIDPMESEKILFHQWPWWKRFVISFGGPLAFYALYQLFEWTNININNPWKARSYRSKTVYAFPPSASDHHEHH